MLPTKNDNKILSPNFGTGKILLLLYILFILSAFTSSIKWNVPIGTLSINLNLSHLVCLCILIYFLFSNLPIGRSFPLIYKDYPSLFLFLYFFTNLFSSAFISVNKAQSIKGSILIFTFWIIYIIARWISSNFFSSKLSVRYFLKFNYLSAIIGLSAMIISFILGKEVFGVTTQHLGQQGIGDNIPSIKSLSLEPNLFAIITASILCINIAFYLLYKKNKNRLFVIILIASSVVFAYTRSVYFAFLIALFVMLYLAKRINIRNLSVTALGALVLFIAIETQSSNENKIIDALTTRTINIANFSEGTGLLRLQAYLIGLAGFVNSPIIGNGTLSADTQVLNQNSGFYYDLEGSPGWLGSVWIQSLHDTGVIGFIIILGLHISFIIINYKLFKTKNIDAFTKSMLLGFLAGNIIITIGSQISSIFWISFPFIFWGVNMSMVSEIKRKLALSNSLT